MIEVNITIGKDAYARGRFVYVWLNGLAAPIYVGETGRSVADRVGLHIRNPERSGAIVADRYLSKGSRETYTVLAFPISTELLEHVAGENRAPGCSEADKNRAQKAIERRVYDFLARHFPRMHRARGCKWNNAAAADDLAQSILQTIKDRVL